MMNLRLRFIGCTLAASAAFSLVPAASAQAASPMLTAHPPAQTQSSGPENAEPTGPVATGSSPASQPGYRLAPDDSIQVLVWKEPTLSGTFPVRPDGMISLALLGDLHAAGKTPMELSSTITERLRKYIQDPVVTVSVVAANSQKIYVLGEVQKVGPVEMSASMTPLQAISAAGGLTPYAKEKDAYVLRGPAGHQQKIPFNYKKALKGDPNASVVLMAGDTIVVP